MKNEAEFGVFIDINEDKEQQFKVFAEGIKYIGVDKVTAKPTTIVENTENRFWDVYNGNGKDIGEVIFTRQGLSNYCVLNDGKLERLSGMDYYEVKVKSDNEIDIDLA
ncbi:hypothetical protein [Guptibacillus spartinae]|uniref:hypothetical protein n=1 Tax=Guptibacillus spartinae TaxID=3025679 RepID=UPI00235F803C|nr:hypothetical protein [Pseudalkalibacillus spartinae]